MANDDKKMAERLARLSKLIEELGAKLGDPNAADSQQVEVDEETGSVTVSHEIDVPEDQQEDGMPLPVLLGMLKNLSDMRRLQLTISLVPLRERIVGCTVGERMTLITARIIHTEDCGCPPSMNYCTLLEHQCYKTWQGEVMDDPAVIAVYETEEQAGHGHAEWQKQFATYELSELPDTIEGSEDPRTDPFGSDRYFRMDVIPSGTN